MSLIGLGELSAEDQLIYKRAQLLRAYMTQSFFVTEEQTGLPGSFVPVATTVKDVAALLAGKVDDVPVNELLNLGSIAQFTSGH